MLLPMKFSVLECIVAQGSLTLEEVYEILYPKYGGEKQCCHKVIGEHLESLEGSGLLQSFLVETGPEVRRRYEATPYGLRRFDYINRKK